MTDELPATWSWLRLEDFAASEPSSITDGPFGSNLKTADYVIGGEVRVIRLGNLGFGRFIDDDKSFVTAGKFATLTKHEARPGDLVVAALAEPVGRCVEVPDHLGRAMVKADCIRIRVNPAFDRRYVMYALNSPGGQRRAQAAAHGMGRLRINLSDLRSLLVPAAPPKEQRRIVAKLEALQARSRRAREALDAVPPLLEKLRQSILAAAFRGDLTKDWRAKHKDVEPADLSARIGQGTYRKGHLWGSGRTADGVDAEWGVLPPSWQWARVRDLNEESAAAVQIGPMSMKSSEFVDEGVPVLNVGCVQRGRTDITRADHLPPERARDFGRYTLRAGDVLFTRSGTVGRCACLPDNLDGALMTFHLLRVRASVARCSSAYLMYAFQGCSAVAAQIEASSVGATRAGFNTRLLEEMWIPLAPPTEQREVLLRLSEFMSRLESVRVELERVELRLSAMDRETLAKAFRGELVPQDLNDEPAEAMLTRVRDTGESESKGVKGRAQQCAQS